MLKPSHLSKEYLVSDDGYVLSKRGKPLKPSINHKGYEIVNLMVNGKRIGVAVHTLVAMVYCSGYHPGYTVNHKNGNKRCNKSWNLEWVTMKDNIIHACTVLYDKTGINSPKAKKVIAIDKNTKKQVQSFDCFIDACKWLEPNASKERLRCMQKSISRVATGLRKSYKGYMWKV